MLEIGTFNVDIAGTEEKGDGTCDLRRYPDGFPEEKWLRLLRTAYDCIERSVGKPSLLDMEQRITVLVVR